MQRYNIYHRRDGRWEGRISRGKGKNGKRRYQYIFAHTETQVKNRIDEIRRNEAKISECQCCLSKAFEEWFSSVLCKIKESTAANYQMKAKKHILPYFGSKPLVSVTSADIRQFISDKQLQGLSNRYISDIIVLIRSIFKYAVRTYHILNPMDDVFLPKKQKSEVQLLDADEQKSLQDYISKNQNHTTLGIAITMSTGLRIGELCALQWKDIDLEKRILTVRKTMQRIQLPTAASKTKLIITEPKSESSKRQIPIPECVLLMLKKFKGKDDEYVISGTDKPIEPRTMQYRFSKILNNAKLPSVHFHSLRHIFASNCVRLGFDIKSLSEILGHSTVEITLNRYVHSSFEQKQRYMERIQMNF